MKLRLCTVVVFCCISISLGAQEISKSPVDSVLVNGTTASYKGGLKQFCSDYQTLILEEAKRIEAEKAGKKLGLASNDVISSVFRVMGLVERIDAQKFGLLLDQCS